MAFFLYILLKRLDNYLLNHEILVTNNLKNSEDQAKRTSNLYDINVCFENILLLFRALLKDIVFSSTTYQL